MYFASTGRPTDIGLQLGKACYHCSRCGYRGMFLLLLFHHFHSFSSFSTLPLSSPLLSLSSLSLVHVEYTK